MNTTSIKLRTLSSAKERRNALEKHLSLELTHMGNFSLDEGIAGSRNCENMIGVAQVPVGVAGPLTLTHLSHEHGEYYLPLATTEGALVASVNRGCKAITASGGATVESVRAGVTRGPVFKIKNLAESNKLSAFIDMHFQDIKKITEETSRHLTLNSITSKGVGRYRFLRFSFDTQDAMGLNMVTIATDRAVAFIEAQTGATCTALSGNFCVDKKPSWQNFVHNRGFAVWAETVVPKAVLGAILKTEAAHVYETWMSKCMLGSVMSGSMGFNAQYANIIAALFIATGQDPAHVVEGSLGVTTAEVIYGGDLYMSIYLPDLMLGTVGGGTGLATQHEALSMLGVAKGGHGEYSKKLAEIVGGAVLAGELSLLSSLEQGTLSGAHETLARGKSL